MKELYKKLFWGICFLFSLLNGYSQQTITEWMNTAQQRIDTLRKGNFTITVRDSDGNIVNDSISIKLKRHEFVFGCAADFSLSSYGSDPNLPSTNDWIKTIILKYFNMNVTGNAYKWSGVQPNNASSYDYAPVDSVVNWADRVGLDKKGHTLIWGAYNDSDYHSIPKWVMQLPNKQAIYNACETRVRSMVAHYKGKFKEIDVLNEPLHAPWLKNKLGSDSIYWNLFKWAKAEDPNAKLIINEYNVEFTNSWSHANEYKALIKKILSHGGPVESIGVQAHFSDNFDMTRLGDLKRNMDTLATLGLPMKFTEFDLNSMPQASQASNTSSIFRFVFSHPAFNGIISWGLWDAGVWRANSGYFDTNKNPKIAADTIYKLIHKVWTTDITSKITTSSTNFNGYYGQYDVKVKFGNTWKQFSVNCDKLHNDSVFVLKEQNSSAVKPQFKSAWLISRNRLLIKFDQKMQNPLPSKRAFKIFQINPIKIDSISLLPKDSSIVSIKLATAVNNNLITVSYLEGSLKSAKGGILEAFGPEKIDNNFVELSSAATSKNGKLIEAKFNKSMLDPSAQPITSFSVKVNGLPVGLDSIRLKTGNDSIILLALTNAVVGGDAILLYYNGGTVASKDGHELVPFGSFTVTNNVPQFLFVSATTTKDGNKVQAKFNMPVSFSTAQIADFSVLATSVSVGIDSIRLKEGNDSVMVFSLAKVVKSGETVTLSYTKGNMASVDGFKLASFSKSPVTNNVPVLALVYANTSTDGKTVFGKYNKPMSDPSTKLSSFSIYVNNSSITMDSVRLKPDNDSVMIFTLRNPVKPGDNMDLFYTAGSVAATNGEKLATIRFFAIINNTVATGIEAQKAVEIALYPNPARNLINIKGNTHINTVKIYNPMGLLILEEVVNSEIVHINISELPEGTYLLSAFSEETLVFKTKFIRIK